MLSGTSETVPESVVLSPLKSQKVDLPPATPTNSELPVGRKGRLANLAATIGSWEDDLAHPPIRRDNTQTKPGTTSVRPPVSTVSSNSERLQSARPAAHKSVDSGQQVGHANNRLYLTVFIMKGFICVDNCLNEKYLKT